MREKKDRSFRTDPSISYEIRVSDIQIASHSHEPYIIAFRYTGDNVASRSLGILAGFFEVDIRDEDSAYIVNFLASVAKKEYFANPRRGAIDSFEAALHKVNVALSELVKHGNVSWLGHLHGALILISGNTIHFSVTGDANILLFRDDTLRSISDGLIEEDHEPHPLKTFVEIASGALVSADRIFLCSTSLWNLFTPDDIERHARRLSREALEQFLKTALVNELASAGVILISCENQSQEETPPKPSRPSSAPRRSLENVFSEQPFRAPTTTSKTSNEPEQPLTLPEGEFVDTKTGHIYVQGQDLTEEERPNGFSLWWSVTRENGLISVRQMKEQSMRISRRLKKQLRFSSLVTLQFLARIGRSLARRTRVLIRRSKLWWKARQAEKKTKREEISPVIESAAPSQKLQEFIPERAVLPSTTPSSSFVNSLKDRITFMVEGGLTKTITFLPRLKAFAFLVKERWGKLSSTIKRIVIGIVVLTIALCGSLLFTGENPPVSEVPSMPIETIPAIPKTTQDFPLTEEKSAVLLEPSNTLLSLNENDSLITLLTLDEDVYAVTPQTIIRLSNTERTDTPERIRLAAAMDDLDTLFLITESGKLLGYTPANKRFTESSLPLPSPAAVSQMDAYLTYLYTLDATNGTLYRFPRVEGGFGVPTTWFKEPVVTENNTSFSVNDIVVLGQNNVLHSYSRGVTETSGFETTLYDFTLKNHSIPNESGEIYALDQNFPRIIVWNKTGVLLHQYFSEELRETNLFTLSHDRKLLYHSNTSKISSVALPE